MTAPNGWQQGSFRGVPFRTEDAETTGGRRGVVHEFPQAEKPVWEDLGRVASGYAFECHVVGADHIAQANRLAAALDAAGAGTLVHPWIGTIQVAVPEYSRQDSTIDGGITRFSVRYVETGLPAPTAPAIDTKAQAEAAADAAEAAAPGQLAKRFSVAGATAFVEEAADKLITGAATLVALKAGLQGGVGAALRAIQSSSLLGGAGALLRSPIALGLAVVGLIQTLGTIRLGVGGSGAARDAGSVGSISAADGNATIVDSSSIYVTGSDSAARADTMRALMDWGSDLDPVIGNTAARALERANQLALVQLVNLAASAELVRCYAQTDFASYDDAVAARDDAADRLDILALRQADIGDDDGAEQYDALRRAVTADLTARGGTLSRLQSYTPAITEPALVVAQRLYGDPAQVVARADEIVARNRIAHPGFVRGGVALQILSRDAV